MHILKFSQFLTEAKQSKHIQLRLKQRIIDSLTVELPYSAIKLLKKKGLSEDLVIKSITDVVRDKFIEKFNRVSDTFNAPNEDFAVLALRPVLRLDDQIVPIRMSVSSYDEYSLDNEKTYSGEKLVIYVRSSTMTTIKVLPESFTGSDIIKNFENNLKHSKKYKNPVRFMDLSPTVFVNLDSSGQAYTDEVRSAASRQLKDFTLSPGRKIGYYNKLTDSLVEAEIVEVINHRTYQSDKEFKVKVKKEDGSFGMKLIKSGNPLWIEANGSTELIKVIVADQLYTIDKRLAHPILKVLV